MSMNIFRKKTDSWLCTKDHGKFW